MLGVYRSGDAFAMRSGQTIIFRESFTQPICARIAIVRLKNIRFALHSQNPKLRYDVPSHRDPLEV